MLPWLLSAFLIAESAAASATIAAIHARPTALREWNPILRPLTRQPPLFGAATMGGAAVAAWGLSRAHATHPKLVTTIAIVAVASASAAAVQADRARRR